MLIELSIFAVRNPPFDWRKPLCRSDIEIFSSRRWYYLHCQKLFVSYCSFSYSKLLFQEIVFTEAINALFKKKKYCVGVILKCFHHVHIPTNSLGRKVTKKRERNCKVSKFRRTIHLVILEDTKFFPYRVTLLVGFTSIFFFQNEVPSSITLAFKLPLRRVVYECMCAWEITYYQCY